MNFLSHEIINARANIITCELNIQAYTDDLLEHNEALDELLRKADEMKSSVYGKKQPKKLSVQYREPVRKLLKLCKSVDFRDAYLLIDQLCEVDMKVITEGKNILRDLEILQRVRKVVLKNSFKSKS
tara:strand:- start:867 stop:1247 length:381 start_codon:yes stop_codon:yes gene_type:complete